MIIIPNSLKKKRFFKDEDPKPRKKRKTLAQSLTKRELEKFFRIMRNNILLSENDKLLHSTLVEINQEDYEFLIEKAKMNFLPF